MFMGPRDWGPPPVWWWWWWRQRGSSGHTAVDSGAFTAGRKGERLGWRNFKDCCRQEGLWNPVERAVMQK